MYLNNFLSTQKHTFSTLYQKLFFKTITNYQKKQKPFFSKNTKTTLLQLQVQGVEKKKKKKK